MEAGPLQYPTVYQFLGGVDADLHIYLTSDSTLQNSRFTVVGVQGLVSPESLLFEAARMVAHPDLKQLATDWRLMTKPEVLAYRRDQLEEHQRAREDRSEVAGGNDKPG